jgi:cytochrome c-type biogenesis protein CcmH/NrfG
MENGAPSKHEPLPLDARPWLFWQTWQRSITVGILLLILGLLGWGAWQAITAHRDRVMQHQFLEALDHSERLEPFAQRYRSQPLGALAWFLVGNDRSGEGNFSAAADAYSHCGALKSAQLDGVATLARAVALLENGDGNAAESLLRSLTNDGKQLSVVRGGSWYFLGWIYHGRGRDDLAKAALDAIGQLPFPGIWAQKAALLALELDR